MRVPDIYEWVTSCKVSNDSGMVRMVAADLEACLTSDSNSRHAKSSKIAY